jgi:hypothetical protein
MKKLQGFLSLVSKPSFMILLWILVFVLQSAGVAADLPSNRVSDISNTRHNFSAAVVPSLPGAATRRVEATAESEICVFCHTPHGAESGAGPIWNRKLSGETYTLYGSDSMDAVPGQPNGTSKLCLSCHDGALAIGAVNVVNAAYTDQDPLTEDIDMYIEGGGTTMPDGEGTTSGFTRDLSADLSNDHPISFTYDTTLATADGELRDPSSESFLGDRSSGVHPVVPLEQDQLQCISCHDPHIRSTDLTENIKFLRLNRLQQTSPTTTTFNESTDIICLACHDKAGWVNSAHASDLVANEQYTDAAATLREFPLGTKVWESACLGCHDTHTVQGSRRLLREGTDGARNVNGAKQGGNPSIEEACYACHSSDGGVLTSQGYGTEVPDIKTDFSLTFHMPISSSDQPAGAEIHDIGSNTAAGSGKDFMESPLHLGKGNSFNRHAECTDCHNPHRVIKNRQFNDDPATPDAAGTHDHSEPHSNLASGVLRGAWGVEPVYVSDEFMSDPFDFQDKRGNPPINGLTDVGQPYVTREYQVCLKCHSNFAYDTPPLLGESGGGTPSGTRGLTQYTNQAMEFQAPDGHMGVGTSTTSSGAHPNWTSNNHRSWHPVMKPTGRSKSARSIIQSNIWKAPYDNDVGTQTMYCTDCHGNDTAIGTAVPDGGENGNPWGPHGSSNQFILKGKFDITTGTPCDGDNCTIEPRNDQEDDLCFKCHNIYNYAIEDGSFGEGSSGFRKDGSANLHTKHLSRLKRLKCSWCHAAVPHGWKNKALLVNLNDVGPEAGEVAGTEIPLFVDGGGTTQLYVQAPYYNGAIGKILQFDTSGNWDPKSCGSVSGEQGQGWMTDVCNNLP